MADIIMGKHAGNVPARNLSTRTFPQNHQEIDSDNPMGQPFSIKEMEKALSHTKGETPGQDGITYKMLKMDPPAFHTRLLKL
jgi:hypothetical protein